MIEVEATLHMNRLGRGQRALVDETDPTVKKMLRCGNFVPTGRTLGRDELGDDVDLEVDP